MNILQKVVFKIVQFFTYLYMGLGGYTLWARVYQATVERKDLTYPLKTHETYQDLLMNGTRKMTYEPDGPKQLWDVISSAGRIQRLIDTGVVEAGVDCDEFGWYITSSLTKSAKEGVLKETMFREAHLMTVMWRTSTGTFTGHNVGLITSESPDGRRWYQYMDYSMPYPARSSVKNVVEDILASYAAGGELLCYAIHDSTLHTVSASTKL